MSDSYKRVILITGSNGGIGYELVRMLAEKGHIVYMAARNTALGKESQRRLKEEHNLDVNLVQLDVTDSESILAVRNQIESAHGRLDTLVNNSAAFHHHADQDAATISLTTLREVFAVNFDGLVAVTTTFLPLIRKSKRGYGTILNVSSRLGSNTMMAKERLSIVATAYRTSKAAVNAYTIELAWELREERIRVNAVSPGFVATRANHFHPEASPVVDGALVFLPWCLLGPDDDDKTGQFYGPHGKMEW